MVFVGFCQLAWLSLFGQYVICLKFSLARHVLNIVLDVSREP